MKIAKPMRGKNKFLAFSQNNLLVIACALTLLLAGCQSSQSSSSSSSPSTPSTSTPTPSPSPSQPAPQPSSTSSSSSSQSQSSQNQAEQQNSGDSELGGEDTAYDESGGGTDNETGGEVDGYEEPQPGTYGGSGEVLSQEESVAILDGQLDESMTVFDGMIINERATVKANESEFPDEEGSVFGDDNPLFEEADITEDSDGPIGSTSDETEGNGGDIYSENSSETDRETVASRNGGVNTSKGGSQVPSNIPDGNDDDIVARQIREAAMKEQDPVLREKLWEEYRKYKQGQ